MSVERILDLLDTLTLAEARKVDEALHRYIALVEEWQRPAPNVVEIQNAPGGCYRLEYVRCGKCKRCAEGGYPHGPYWYKYSYRPGGQRKTYIGKQRPG